MEYPMEPEPDPPVQEKSRPGGRALMRRWLAVIALVAGLAGGGWVAVQHYQTHQAAEEALAAAQAYVLRLTNIDAGNVDQNLADIADGATGEFRGMHTRSGAKMRQLLIDHHATARGHVTEATVKSATKDNVVVVLLVDQAVTNRSNAEPVIDRSRLRMTMQKVDGRWLASKVALL